MSASLHKQCSHVTVYHHELLRVSLFRCICVCVCAPVLQSAEHQYVFFVCVSVADNFTDAAVTGRINGEHKEKDLEPWDGGETHNSDSLESLDTDVVRKHNNYATHAWDVMINGFHTSLHVMSSKFDSERHEETLYHMIHCTDHFLTVFQKFSLLFFLCSYQSNGWDPNDMFKYNEEKYGVLSTYDSSLSTYT